MSDTSKCSSPLISSETNSIEANETTSSVDIDTNPKETLFCYEVQFKCTIGHFLSEEILNKGDYVTVEGDRGYDVGVIHKSITDPTATLKVITKLSDNIDAIKNMLITKINAENAALVRCREFCSGRRIGLYLDTVAAEFQFDRKKLTVYVKKSGDVSVCKLVRKLYDAFKMRISVEEVTSMDPIKETIAQYLSLSNLDISFDEVLNYQPVPNTYSPPQSNPIEKSPQKPKNSPRPMANSSQTKKPSKIHHHNPSLVTALHDYMPAANVPIDDIYRKHQYSRQVRQNSGAPQYKPQELSAHQHSYVPYVGYDNHPPIAPTLPSRVEPFPAPPRGRVVDHTNSRLSYRETEILLTSTAHRFSELSFAPPIQEIPLSLLKASDTGMYDHRHLSPGQVSPTLISHPSPKISPKIHSLNPKPHCDVPFSLYPPEVPLHHHYTSQKEWMSISQPSPSYSPFDSDFFVSPSLSGSSSPSPLAGRPPSASNLF